MLQQSLRSTIKYFNFLVGAAGSEASAIGVEFDTVNHTGVVGELLDLLLNFLTFSNIPKSHSSVVTTRSDHS
jgi:hypothetical protein